MEPQMPLDDAIDTIHLFNRLWLHTKQDLPVRPSEIKLLLLLVKSKAPLTPVMAADALRVTKQMITTLARPLLKKGYIEKRPSKSDGRSFILVPTRQGKNLVKQRYAEYTKTICLLQTGLGENDFNTLMALLQSAAKLLEEGDKGE